MLLPESKNSLHDNHEYSKYPEIILIFKKLLQILLEDTCIQHESSDAGERRFETLFRNIAKNKVTVVWPCHANEK